MKKTQRWLIAIGAALMIAAESGAQPDFYYRFMGNYDHGAGNESCLSFTGNGYLMTGTANTPLPGNIPAVFLTEYNNAGAMVWSQIYPLGAGGPGNVAIGTSVAAAPAINQYAILAYSDYSVPAQSVLIRVNPAGNVLGWTPISDFIATSVIYDPFANQYAVLGQSPLNGGDLQLVLVNPGGGIAGFNTYDSGPGFMDTPAKMMIHPRTGNYTLVGTSYNGTDDDVFVVHTNNAGGLLCSETFGMAGNNERGIDVTYGYNFNLGVNTDVVLAYDPAANTPFVIELDANICPSFISSTYIWPGIPNNVPTGITTNPMNFDYMICGEETNANMNGFAALINQNFNPLNYTRYGQPLQPGDEGFNDVLWDPAANFYVFTGKHQRLNPWPGNPTPPGEFFPWLVMTNPNGMGNCPDVQPLNTAPIPLPFIQYPFSLLYFNSNPVTVANFNIKQLRLDECLNPFRMADTKDAEPISVFPNPASDVLTIGNLPEEATEIEITNALGQVVLKQTLLSASGAAQLDIHTLADGIYYYRITSGDAEITSDKLMIAH